MYRFTYRYIFLRRHSAFLSQYACIMQQRLRFWASLYSQLKSDAWQNLNFRYKGKLELSVLLPWLPWLVKRVELRLASDILLIYLYCASKAARKLQKKLLAADTKLEAQGPCSGHRSIIAILYCFSFKYMKREKERDLTQYTNLCGLNTLPH